MRIIYRKCWDDDDLAEVESFHEYVNGGLAFIQAWCLNDAMYRHEYMGPLFTYLDIVIKPLPNRHRATAKQQVKEAGFGWD